MCPQGAFSGCSSRQGDQSFWVPGAEGLLGTPDVQWQNQDCPEQIRMVDHSHTCAERASKGLGRMWERWPRLVLAGPAPACQPCISTLSDATSNP